MAQKVSQVFVIRAV